MKKHFPVSVIDFKDMVSGDYYFVDKTMMIADLCRASGSTFIYTRPRRFGKSINLSMLNYFFNIKYKDDKDIFAGTKISECHMCDEHRNRYPVIRLNLSTVDVDNPDGADSGLKLAVSYVAAEVRTSAIASMLTDWEMQRIIDLENMEANYTMLQSSINWISGLLERLYGEKVIILVDEYDQCIHNIADPAKLEEISALMRGFMQQSFKINDHIRLGVVTGVMPILQTGMFSGFNNPRVCDIFDTAWDEYFGFTEKEVTKLLNDSGIEQDKIIEIREWYDGYRFGDADVYNPFSVNQYLDNGCKVKEYWNLTTTGGISQQLISSLDVDCLTTLKQLAVGTIDSIESPVNYRMSFTDIVSEDRKASDVYSYLAMCGYLKAVPSNTDEGRVIYRMSIVNRDVKSAFEGLIERVKRMEIEAPINLKNDIYAGDADRIANDLILILSGRSMDKTWNHDRYKELLGSVLDLQCMRSVDEMPKGLGKVDIFVKGTKAKPAVAIEIKTSSKEPKEYLASKAMKSILDKGYASEPLDGDVISIGIGIRIKDVAVRVIMPGEY